jgi:hypothetical protein
MKFIKIIAILGLLVGFQTQANTITINLDTNNVQVGDLVNVTLLADFTDMVDTFQFDFMFDTNLFSFVDGSATTDLINDGIDSFFDIAANPSGVGIGYFSFVELAFGNFTLASFDLLAMQEGNTQFSLDTIVLSNELIFAETYELESVDAVSAKVSAPAGLSLMAIAVFGLVSLRRKA